MVSHCLGCISEQDKDGCFCDSECVANLWGSNSTEPFTTIHTVAMKTGKGVLSREIRKQQEENIGALKHVWVDRDQEREPLKRKMVVRGMGSFFFLLFNNV